MIGNLPGVNHIIAISKGIVWIWNNLDKMWSRARKAWGFWCWFIVVFVLTPLKWFAQGLIEAADKIVVAIDSLTTKSKGIVGSGSGGGGNRASEAWTSLSYYVGVAENFFPLQFAVGCAYVLAGMAVMALLIRLIIRFFPSAHGWQIGGN